MTTPEGRALRQNIELQTNARVGFTFGALDEAERDEFFTSLSALPEKSSK